MSDFNATAELQQIRELRCKRQMQRYYRGHSQLDAHIGKLLELHDAGASANDLRVWLKEKHELSVNRSTVCRWLQKATKQRRVQAERHQQ